MSAILRTEVELASEARQVIYKEDLIATYRSRLKSKEGRKWEYLTKVEPLRNGKILAVGVISGVGSGVIVGGACGACCGIPGGPIGVGVGTVIGIGVGATIGFVVASGVIYYEYNQWQKTEEGRKMGGEILAFLESDDTLKDYMCCISHELINDPVKTPDGHVYDRKAIEQWIDRDGTNPMTRAPLTKDMLQPAPEVTGKVANAMIKMLDEDTEALKGMDKGFIEGLKFLKKDIEKKRDNDYNCQVIKLQKLRKDEKISNNEFVTGMAKLQKDFYGIQT